MKTKTNAAKFIAAVNQRATLAGVIGIGYVGLPLALRFCEEGFRVIGFDVDQKKVAAINEGRSYIKYIPAKSIAAARKKKLLEASADFRRASEPDALIICVPTPLTRNREPDMTYIVSTAEAIAPFVRAGQLVTLESTTYPGTTDEVLIPILEKGSGLKAGVDFWVAFSPEREDPNNKEYKTATIPKVVGGFTKDSLAVAQALYGAVIVRTVPVSSTAAAEAAKLLENIFRSVNIALVNELKMVFQRMGIDVWEVIAAAKTKPFGFMPFYPGPGLGGHCIPIDPFYLTWKAREYGLSTRFIELAGEINAFMPEYVVQRTMEVLNEQGQALKGCKILLAGLAYKPNVDDDRESPTYALWDLLQRHGAEVAYHDPYIPAVRPSREHGHLAGIRSTPLAEAPKFDLVIISTAHEAVDHEALAARAKLVIDTRHACADAPNVHRA